MSIKECQLRYMNEMYRRSCVNLLLSQMSWHPRPTLEFTHSIRIDRIIRLMAIYSKTTWLYQIYCLTLLLFSIELNTSSIVPYFLLLPKLIENNTGSTWGGYVMNNNGKHRGMCMCNGIRCKEKLNIRSVC